MGKYKICEDNSFSLSGSCPVAYVHKFSTYTTNYARFENENLDWDFLFRLKMEIIFVHVTNGEETAPEVGNEKFYT